jgi:beta-glucosidase/6-phospho-beta-glucosidase/beta-galactosidase
LIRCADLDLSVTENGFAVKDESSKPIGKALQDNDRVNYFKGTTASLKAAVIEDGVDVSIFPVEYVLLSTAIQLSDRLLS